MVGVRDHPFVVGALVSFFVEFMSCLDLPRNIFCADEPICRRHHGYLRLPKIEREGMRLNLPPFKWIIFSGVQHDKRINHCRFSSNGKAPIKNKISALFFRQFPNAYL